MGFFRRYKLTDYTADECRKEMWQRLKFICHSGAPLIHKRAEEIMEQWACFRELLARHEKENQSRLDTNDGN